MDSFVYEFIEEHNPEKIDEYIKKFLPAVLLESCIIGRKKYYLFDGIRLMTESIGQCIENKSEKHLNVPQMIVGGR